MEEENQTNQQTPTPQYQSKPFRSIEQKILVDSGILEFSKYLIKGAYGAGASLCKIPTFVRKAVNRQLFFQRENIKLFRYKSAIDGGASIGGTVVAIFDVGLIVYTISKASKGEYMPLEILAATNFLSGAVELGRLSKSKQENLELKTQQEAEKVQAAQTTDPLEEPTSGGGG